MAFTENFTTNAIADFEEWLKASNILSRKIPERCENFFVGYRINYEKLESLR